jgi:hypothetical protein
MHLLLDRESPRHQTTAMNRDHNRTKRRAFRVGALPADLINHALQTELEVADVWVSKACHSHIADDHPDDYPVIMANLLDVLLSPTYAGQDPRHGGAFYLVKRVELGVQDRHFALVAIALEVSQHGTYNVKSAYTIKQADVDSRRLNGALKVLF